MMSLQRRIEELEGDLARAISAIGNDPKPSGVVSTVPSSPAVVALLGIKDKLFKETRKTTEEYLHDYFVAYQSFTKNVAGHLGDLIHASINFIEKHTPEMMQLLQIAIEDKSLFKLDTCVAFLRLVGVNMPNIEQIINTIVGIKKVSTPKASPLIADDISTINEEQEDRRRLAGATALSTSSRPRLLTRLLGRKNR